MAVAGPFTAAAEGRGALPPRSVPRWLSHVGRGVALWSMGAYGLVVGVVLVVWVMRTVRGMLFAGEALRVGGIEIMQGVLAILMLTNHVGMHLFVVGAGAGLVVALITLPLAWRRPGIIPRIAGLVVSIAALSWAFVVLTVDGLVVASMTAGQVGVFVVAGAAGWFGAPRLWPPELRTRRSSRRVLPSPNPADRIARPFPN